MSFQHVINFKKSSGRYFMDFCLSLWNPVYFYTHSTPSIWTGQISSAPHDQWPPCWTEQMQLKSKPPTGWRQGWAQVLGSSPTGLFIWHQMTLPAPKVCGVLSLRNSCIKSVLNNRYRDGWKNQWTSEEVNYGLLSLMPSSGWERGQLEQGHCCNLCGWEPCLTADLGTWKEGLEVTEAVAKLSSFMWQQGFKIKLSHYNPLRI